MPQKVSITEARDNFPALVRRITDTDEPVVVTNRSQPRVVMIRWETYQEQKDLQEEGAKHRLQVLVSQMEQIVNVLLEAYQPDGLDLLNGQQDLSTFASKAWTTCSLLDKPRRLLASLVSDGFLNLTNRKAQLSVEQLTQLNEVLPLLHQPELTMDLVAQADRALAEVGFDSTIPFGDDLVKQYFPIIEDEA